MASPSCRISVLLARKSPLAAVFRRGPSKQVLLLRWDRSDDSFEEGQWFKGRIYEERCDLSPSGERLIYFAAKHTGPFGTWTAVSRPPYFTARALWPNGTTWGGGGLFESETTVRLNHGPADFALAPDFKLPARVRVLPFGPASGRGEDEPIASARMERDGWEFVQRGAPKQNGIGARLWVEFKPPEIWERASPRSRSRGPKRVLRRLQLGIHERQGPRKVFEYELHGPDEHLQLGRLDWADWDQNGDLLFARDGALFRMNVEDGVAKGLIDLRGLEFTQREPPVSLIW